MKNLIIGFGTIMMSVLTIMIMAALNINTINKLDLETATRLAVYQTLEQRYDDTSTPMMRVKNADNSYKKFSDYPSSSWQKHTETINGTEEVIGYTLIDSDGSYKYSDADKKYVFEEFEIKDDDTLVEMFNENLSMLLKKQDFVTVKIMGVSYYEGLLSVNVSYTYDNLGVTRTIDTTQTVIRETSSLNTIADDYVYAVLYTDGELAISRHEIEKDVNKPEKINYGKVDLSNKDFPVWIKDASNITTVRIATNITPISCYGWFKDCSNLTKIENIENLNTSESINMKGLFYKCSSLQSVDLSHFDTSKVKDMSLMFTGCSSLTSIDVSTFNTNKVTNMKSMFAYCSNITNLDLSNFKTSKVTDMSHMFNTCSNLKKLDLSNFDTSNVTNMTTMFSKSSTLTEITGLNKFKTSNVTDMSQMFNECKNLTTIDVSKFDTSNVTNMQAMFQLCEKVQALDVSKFNTSKVTDMSWMFYNCINLTTLNVSNFDTSNVTNMHSMFYYLSNITKLDVSNFKTSKVTDVGFMFQNCSKLSELNLGNFDGTAIIEMTQMFNSCDKTRLVVSSSQSAKNKLYNEITEATKYIKTWNVK